MVSRREFITTGSAALAAIATSRFAISSGSKHKGSAMKSEHTGKDYEQIDLPYAYDALEPHIDARTMEIHYSKHYFGYVRKLNDAVEDYPELTRNSIEDLLWKIDTVPQSIRQRVIDNGGGSANHALYWKIMGPHGGGEPKADLARAIDKDFGSCEAFKEKFSKNGAGVFGSGWSWLVVDGDGRLHAYSTANQDSPLLKGHKPILALDVWEHAYYLKYQNRRGDYIDAWWNVVNWDKVAEMYDAAKA